MANVLADKGQVVNAPNQGAMKTIFANWRDFTSNLLGGSFFDAISPAAFTVSSGILSVPQDYGIGGYILVSRAASITTAFDLTGIVATNFKPGQMLIIGTQAGMPMTVHHQQPGVSNGQILLRGGADVTLTDQESSIALRLEGATGPWREIWRSAGGSATGGLTGLNMREYTTAANYAKPSNLVSAIVMVAGAGGGGAGKPATNVSAVTLASGGGGAGGLAIKFFNEAELPATCALTIGSAGAGGSDSNTYTAGNQGVAFARGTTGGASSFSGTGIATITASGGAGGAAFVRGRSGIGLIATASSSAAGGAAAGGDWNFPGNAGNPGAAVDIDDNRTRAHNAIGGRGGDHFFSSEQPIVRDANAQAYPAGQYGGGGNGPTGAVGSFGRSFVGAAGAPGVIYILEALN